MTHIELNTENQFYERLASRIIKLEIFNNFKSPCDIIPELEKAIKKDMLQAKNLNFTKLKACIDDVITEKYSFLCYHIGEKFGLSWTGTLNKHQ